MNPCSVVFCENGRLDVQHDLRRIHVTQRDHCAANPIAHRITRRAVHDSLNVRSRNQPQIQKTPPHGTAHVQCEYFATLAESKVVH